MECPSCRHENRDHAQFCEECGAKIERACSACGNALGPEARFCDRCGNPAGDAARKSPGPPLPETGTKEQAAGFSTYTPKHLVDKVLKSRSAFEGERKQVTVLFADVCNYTGISETLDPEDVHRIMDGCFEILTGEIHRFEGTVNQFTGDGIMALFGAPSPTRAPQRALRAALAVQETLRPYGEEVRSRYGVEFRMRIGINTGTVVVGRIGDDLRMDYTAAGDTTNLAARLQSLAEPGSILASTLTHRLTKDYFDFSETGPVKIKGKSEPVEIFRLIGPKEIHSRMDAASLRGLTPLVGEAGIGKSRLAHEFKNRLQGEDITLFEAYCPSYGQATPFLPVAQIIKKYCGIQEGDDELKIREKVTSA